MVTLRFIPQSEFQRVHSATIPRFAKLAIIADMNRANTLVMVKRAGSGHLGSSLSSLDLFTLLYYDLLNITALGVEHHDRDVFFSSKGHDAPGQYAVLHSLGILSAEQVLKLRRLGGVQGHPERIVAGMEANTGSLGMGISKGKGIAIAKKLSKHGGRVVVLTGDGELQEGQNYEALQTAIHHRVTNLLVVMDHNKLQSDKLVSEICNLGDLEHKLAAFGWYVDRCDGHDYEDMERAFKLAFAVNDRPKFIIAHTLKGCGVSFMEHPQALKDGEGVYHWHSGAPDDASFMRAHEEVVSRVNRQLTQFELATIRSEEVAFHPPLAQPKQKEFVADGYEQALLELGKTNPNIIVLDGDLAADCRVRSFEGRFPERFIENGISEQDMVSTAGGLALQGYLPVVNSFASFLAARANEQIYANACERTKIIYACHYAGITPAGPGSSHQSVRDISLFAALPDVLIVQPSNPKEAAELLRYFVERATETCMMRLQIGPSPEAIALPSGYVVAKGRGVILEDGDDAVLFAYGPVMVYEALLAGEKAKAMGLSLRVVNMPWLNVVEPSWLMEAIDGCRGIFVLEDHSLHGGLGEFLLPELINIEVGNSLPYKIFGVADYLACGTREEVLRHHCLDADSLVGAIKQAIG